MILTDKELDLLNDHWLATSPVKLKRSSAESRKYIEECSKTLNSIFTVYNKYEYKLAIRFFGTFDECKNWINKRRESNEDFVITKFRILNSQDCILFGKYKGQKLYNIPGNYLRWCTSNISGFYLSWEPENDYDYDEDFIECLQGCLPNT